MALISENYREQQRELHKRANYGTTGHLYAERGVVAPKTGKAVQNRTYRKAERGVPLIGLGDWIMATADARRFNERHKCRVVFGDGRRKHWNFIFEGNPRIAEHPEEDETLCWIANFPGHRPYITKIENDRITFNFGFKSEPGEIYLKPREVVKPLPRYVVVEPNVKQNWYPGVNKDWGFANWQALVSKLDLPWVQLGPPELSRLKGVKHHKTNSIRDAMGILANADLLVTTDGALHHAAAAMGVPAVVLWGGFAPPQVLGYEDHTNIYHGGEPCGRFRVKCDHCRKWMNRISVDEVKTAIERSLEAIRGGVAAGSRGASAELCDKERMALPGS
jgi:hypothetical protein